MKPTHQNRRRFPRLDVTEEARVFDEGGRDLGIVSKVSGGGMTLEPKSPEVAESLAVGKRLRVTVTEPGSRATNVVDVIVRSTEPSNVGFEFVSAVAEE